MVGKKKKNTNYFCKSKLKYLSDSWSTTALAIEKSVVLPWEGADFPPKTITSVASPEPSIPSGSKRGEKNLDGGKYSLYFH